jgi:uncharacterized protein YjbJ (UPF0337 family)
VNKLNRILKQGGNMGVHVDKVRGRIKQAVGDLTNNKRLKAEGEADELRGAVKDRIDTVADKLKERI